MMRIRSLALGALALLGLFHSTASATWSIIVVNRATDEVCVAGATCIANFSVRPAIAVVVVGKGGGCAQSFVDISGANRRRIWNGLMLDRTPEEILVLLENGDAGHQTRQYGIVSLEHGAVTFTGDQAGLARGGVVGEQEDLVYAIQGNVLTGIEVVNAAEAALLATSGDVGQKVMAAMEAARAFGGDGRCSCSQNAPDSCGSPPASFDKSAHTAFITIARIGDEDGICDGNVGCANGSYYLHRLENGDNTDPDPVLVLQAKYDNWRIARIGEVDQVLTQVVPSAPRMVADGTTTVDVDIRLRDLDDNPLAFGGQTVAVRALGDSAASASVVGMVDNGDGTHRVTFRAGTTPGITQWRISVRTGTEDPILLHPPLKLRVDPLVDLHSGFEQVMTSNAVDVPLVVNAGAANAGRTYQILASAAGTSPGSVFNGTVIPLNQDRLLHYTATRPGGRLFPGSLGVLDGNGRAEATLRLDSGVLSPFTGGRFDFAAVLFGTPDDVTSTTGFVILP